MIQKQELEKDKTAINDEKIKQLDIQINEVNQKMDELETYLIDAGLLIPYIPVDLDEFE
jgi:cob(I)alamin adenosyltransferase